jgi:hypothetical protein
MKMTRREIADVIDAFLDGTGGERDWNDFTSVYLDDPELDAVRQRCVDIRDEFPPKHERRYCGDEGSESFVEPCPYDS